MNRHLVAFLASAAVAVLCLHGAARQTLQPSSVGNIDIRLNKEQAPAGYLARVGSDVPQALLTGLAEAREKGLNRLQATYRSLEVLSSPALGVPEVVGTAAGTGFLTGPSADRVATMRSFLSTFADAYGLTAVDARGLAVVANYENPSGNMAWVELEQRINGLPVFQGTIRGGFTAKGELARTTGLLASGIDAGTLPTSPSISAPQAIALAAASVGWDVDERQLVEKTSGAAGRATFSRASMADDPTVWLVYFPLSPGLARLAWATQIIGDPMGYLVLLDAQDGSLLFRKNLTDFQTQPASYTVYTDDSPAPLSPTTMLPGSGTQAPAIPRTTVTLVGNEPPLDFNINGWITDGGNATDGNNVEAGVDLDFVDGVDAPTTGVSRVFNFPYNPGPGIPAPGDPPTSTDYRNGEVTNMFYWSNLYHDRLYLLGFTEPAGNFQKDNFGRGGNVNADPVRAEAQDFSGTNNANFFTPADGVRGRMQMFVFTGPNPDRSSGLDQELVLHELTHGTSNRLHGNASGLITNMARGMGEGWSDFYARALLATADEDVNGIYSTGGYVTHQLGTPSFTDNYYYGIRRFPYAVKTTVGGPSNRPHNPLTFADVDASQFNISNGAFAPSPIIGGNVDEVHNLGEVWAMALFEVRARFIARLGFATGNERVLQFVTDAMKLEPVNPTMLQGRDAIIVAAGAGAGTAADIADIWAGFATRGMGVSAQITNQGSGFGGAASIGINDTRVVEAFDEPGISGAAGTLVSESIPNGRVDPGETIDVSLCVTNNIGTPSGAVTGTVLAGGGVLSPSGAQSYGEINLSANVCRTFTFTVSASCGEIVSVSMQAQETGGATRVFTYPFQVGALVPSFSENFDGVAAPALPAGWSTSTLSGTPNLWVTNTTQPDTAPNRAFVSDPATVSDNVLVSPTIPLPAGSNRLTFRHRHATEANFDGGVLEVAIGGGGFQDLLVAGGTFVHAGYSGRLSTQYENPLPGRRAWTGSSFSYMTTIADLPAAAGGQNVQLRWRFGSDNDVAGNNWAVDGITIGQFACTSPPPPAPIAVDDAYAVGFNAPRSLAAPGVLSNDTGTGSLTASLVANVTHGTLALAADGSFTYTPTSGYIGGDTFTYRANNAGGPSNVATVTLTVGGPAPPPAPIAVNDAYSASLDTLLSVTLPGVLSNDTGTGPLTASLVANVTHGTLALAASGNFTYTPTTGFVGGDSFTYRANNAGGPSNVATVTLTVVGPGPQPPTALYASSIVGNTVTLRWNAPALGAAPTTYILEGGVNPGDVLASVPTGSTAPTVTLVAPTGAFFVRMHTQSGAEKSAASNEIQVFVNTPTPPSAPANLLGLVNGSTLGLAWRNTFEAGAPTSVIIDVTGTLSGSVPLGLTESFSFAGVPPGTFTFTVRAANGAGPSVASNPVTFTFPAVCSGGPQPPVNFLAYKVGSTLFVLWDPPTAGPAPASYVLNVTGSFVGGIPIPGRAISGAVAPGTYNLSVQSTNACGTSPATPVQSVVVP